MNEEKLMRIEPLSAEAFCEFGDVIEISNRSYKSINWDYTKKYNDLALADTSSDNGETSVHIYQTKPMGYPLEVKMLEAHPKGSQLFFPLNGERFLVVVAPKSEVINEDKLRCFLTNGLQGVSYAKGVWHHPVLALDKLSHFIVVDRSPTEDNLVEHDLKHPRLLDLQTL